MNGFWGAVRSALGRGGYGRGALKPWAEKKDAKPTNDKSGDFDFKLFFDRASDGMLLADMKTKKLLFGNAEIQKMLGYTNAEFKKIGVADLHPEEELGRVYEIIKQQGNKHMGTAKDLPMLRKNGERFFADVSSCPVRFRNRWYLMGIFRDVTERKTAEDRIRCLDRLYRVNSRINKTIIKAKNRDELFKSVCGSLVDLGGYAMVWIGAANFKNKTVTPVSYGGKGSEYLKKIRISLNPRSSLSRGPTGRAVLTGKAVSCSNILRDPKMAPWRKNALKWGYSSSISLPLRIGNEIFGALNVYSQEPMAFSAKQERLLLEEVAEDISFALLDMEREGRGREAEAVVRERDARFAKFASQTPGMLYQFERKPDGKYRIPFTTRAIEDLFGVTAREVKLDASPLFKAILPEDTPRVVETIEQSAKLLKTWTCEYRVKLKDGKVRWLWGQSIPEKLSDGGVLWHGFIADVTDQKLAEAGVKKEKEKAESYLNIAQVVLVAMDDKARITLLNKKGYALLGYKEGELLGKDWFRTCLPREQYETVHAVYQQMIKGKIKPFEYYENDVKTKTGVVRHMAWHNSLIKDGEGHIIGTLSSGEDITERIKAENALKEAYAKDEALLDNMAIGVVAVDAQGKIILANSAAESALGWAKGSALGQDWSSLLSVCNEKSVCEPKEKSLIYQAYKYGVKSFDDTHYYKRKNGTLFPVVRTAAPIVLGGKIIGAVKTFRDITADKELDRAKTDFLSMVSHQLRTPLVSIKWAIELFKSEANLTTEQLSRLDELNATNERLVALVSSLLNVTRIEAGKLVVNKVTTDVAKLVGESLLVGGSNAKNRGQKILLKMSPRRIIAHIDPLLIKEALNNLIDNAVSYAPENSAIKIEVKRLNAEVIFSVHNQGSFIPAADKDKIYGKLFRGSGARQARPEGSGLGLYVAKAVIEASGGKIWFKSNKRTGTTFYFAVPKHG